jgi:DNA polymerase III delta' subunit
MRFGVGWSICIFKINRIMENNYLSFAEIIGHQEVLSALNSALSSGKVGHAYLFAGAAHLGKKTIVRAFARRLLCQNQADADCQCESCRRFRSDAHPDLITVVPDGNTIKIEQLRELQHQTYLGAVLGRYKIFYFPETEKLTETAANSFLKILEDAPPGVVFLFAAVRLDYILPTIRSRCQVYNLFPVSLAEITAGLQRLGITASEAERRAAACGGLPGLALQPPTEQTPDFISLTEIRQTDLINLLKLATELEKQERPQILAMLQEWQVQANLSLSRLCRDEQVNSQELRGTVALIEKLSQMMTMVESNVNIRLVLEEFFIAVQRSVFLEIPRVNLFFYR